MPGKRRGATSRPRRSTSRTAQNWQVSFLLHGGFDGPLFIPVDSHEDVLDDRIEADTVFIAKPTVFPRAAERVVARADDVSWGDMVVVKEA